MAAPAREYEVSGQFNYSSDGFLLRNTPRKERTGFDT
jgi:hypothetical protein